MNRDETIQHVEGLMLRLQAAETRCLGDGPTLEADTKHLVALMGLSSWVPVLLELVKQEVKEPEWTRVDTTRFCGHAPYVCRLPPGHTTDPFAMHSDHWTQWWWERGGSGFTFGFGGGQ